MALADVQAFFDFAEPLCFVLHERARRRWAALPLAWAWVPWETRPDRVRPGAPPGPGWLRLDPATEAAFLEEMLPYKPSRLVPNTNLALRSALWCAARGGAGVGGDFRDSVFRRLYERGLDITHPDVLAGLVERVGLDPIGYLEDIQAGAFEEELRAHGARAEALGLRRAPALVVGGQVVDAGAPGAEVEARLRRAAAASA